MDPSRQLYASVDLLTSLVGCGLWWFAFTRFHKVGVFLLLALTHTVRVAFSFDNMFLAFTGHTLIPFSSSERILACATAISYVSMVVWVIEAFAYILLVRWILRQLQKTRDHETIT
jgi:hypothetical protein